MLHHTWLRLPTTAGMGVVSLAVLMVALVAASLATLVATLGFVGYFALAIARSLL